MHVSDLYSYQSDHSNVFHTTNLLRLVVWDDSLMMNVKLDKNAFTSRMRTGRSLTVCCCSSRRGGSAWCRGGSPWSRGGVCLVRGGSPWSRGGGLPGPGGFSLVPGGFSLVWGGSPWSRGGSPETPPSPPVNRITDTCKNITLATTSLRPVIMISEKGTSGIFESLYQLVQTQVDTMGKQPLTSCFVKKKMFGNDANIVKKKRVHFAVSIRSFTSIVFLG